SHQSAVPGHAILLKEMKKTPLLKLNLKMGQGIGIPLAYNLISSTTALLRELNTMEELIY
ncbi:MAG: nicotinate-nucleotide--dimethylbenzimidazole phosphoribosyltransferase, partial [Lentisphaeraceae bacterium]|nr:nicotinate-nucleotide--dimethylbenzimidazole phosphoribosyltransferase [Lentisphaeraceae bacterium]